MIYRFNRYCRRSYIKILLLSNEYFTLDKDENINEIIDNISQVNPYNYKRYINNIYLEKFLEQINNGDNTKVTKGIVFKKVDDNFLKYSNCLRCIFEGNVCNNHNKL